MDQNVRRLRARAAEQMVAAVRETAPLESLAFHEGTSGVGSGEGAWQTAASGSSWGGAEAWATFRAVFRVPSSWAGSPVRLALALGGQGMAYLDGLPWQGLDARHHGINLAASVCDGQTHEVIVEEYAMGATTAPRQRGTTCTIGACCLQQIDSEARALAYDLLVGAGTLQAIADTHPADRKSVV